MGMDIFQKVLNCMVQSPTPLITLSSTSTQKLSHFHRNTWAWNNQLNHISSNQLFRVKSLETHQNNEHIMEFLIKYLSQTLYKLKPWEHFSQTFLTPLCKGRVCVHSQSSRIWSHVCHHYIWLFHAEVSSNEVDFSETALSLNQYCSILISVQCRISIRVSFAHKQTDNSLFYRPSFSLSLLPAL